MKKKVRITLPKAAKGLNLSSKPGTHPIVGGRQLAPGAFFPSTNFVEPNVEVNSTLKPTDRENANLEAEKGETVVTNLAQTGIPEFYTVGGKRHYDGGTPLSLPPDSFIFSRDRKLAVKDKDILAQFGKNVGKKGKKKYTFAELSKQYDINKYRKILADPAADKHQINTAEMMIENYNKKLGGLAMVQESMKGFPNGIPGIAMPYLMATGIDPAEILPQQQPQAPQGMPMKYGGQNYFAPGGEFEEAETAESLSEMEFEPTQGMLDAVKPSAPAVWDYAAQQKYISSPDYVPGGGEGRGNLYQQGIVDYFTSQGTGGGREAGEQFFKDVARDTGEVYSYTDTGGGGSKWAFDRTATDALAQQKQQEAIAAQQAKDAARGFTPGFKYENDQLFQKRQGRVTGEEHWEASNPVMARLYAKKYGTGELSGKELMQQIKENPEAFASSWGQQAADDAQLAAITLKQFGGGVSEDDYVVGVGELASPEEQALFEQGYYNPNVIPFYTEENRPGAGNRKRVRVTMPGTTPQTSGKPVKVQNIPKGKRKWDMNAEGYDKASVREGDYIRNKDGVWMKVTGRTTGAPEYTGGPLDEKLKGNVADLREAYGRLEQRIEGNPDLRDAIIKQYRDNMAKVKPRKNLSQTDIDRAKGMTDVEIMDNFYRAQKQVMAVQAHKGQLKDNKDLWDKDKNQYINTITELGFDPMDASETAAFQGTYIGLQKLAQDPKFKDELADFRVTPVGKGDEPGGGTGLSTISDIDGWFGNTTVGEAALYAPKANELEMQEAEWDEVRKDPGVKHLQNQYGPGRTPFWTEDIINLGFAAKNLFGIRKELPWQAKPITTLPRPTFLSPDQQIQNILGAQRQGVRGAGAFGSPQAYAANVAAMQANAMQHVANAIGNVHDRNVQVANQFELQRANIINNANVRDAQLATSLHDKNAILNQQFRNAKNQAWDNVRRMGVNMWTNRGMTQNLNTFTDQYDIDPVTGFKYFTSPRELTPKNAQSNDVYDLAASYKNTAPDMTWGEALRFAKASKGLPDSPTMGTGMDPREMAAGYPGSASGGYYPQG
jgi:hypothetical protein